MHALERISLDAYSVVYGPAAIRVARATCLRAPQAPDSPMLNRVVGLGTDGPVDEATLDEALAAMGDTSLARRAARGSRPRARLGLDAVRA